MATCEPWFTASRCRAVREAAKTHLEGLEAALKRQAEAALGAAATKATEAANLGWKHALLDMQEVSWDQVKSASEKIVTVEAAKRLQGCLETLCKESMPCADSASKAFAKSKDSCPRVWVVLPAIFFLGTTKSEACPCKRCSLRY